MRSLILIRKYGDEVHKREAAEKRPWSPDAGGGAEKKLGRVIDIMRAEKGDTVGIADRIPTCMT